MRTGDPFAGRSPAVQLYIDCVFVEVRQTPFINDCAECQDAGGLSVRCNSFIHLPDRVGDHNDLHGFEGRIRGASPGSC